MRVKNISYENLNGLTNCFEFSEKLNVFVGSNGVGKTTSLDCLSILLCGESFSYGKTLEKHIDVKNRENVCTLNMIVETDSKIIDENNETKNIDIEFGIQMYIDKKGKFTRQWFINGTKTTRDKYEEKLCTLFKIPTDLLKIEKINIFKCLVDPNEINNADNQAIYNLVRALTNVISLEYFVNNKEDYAILRQTLAINGYDFKATQSKIKNDINACENRLSYIDTTLNNSQKEVDNYNKELDYDTYNNNVDKYQDLKNKIEDKRKCLVELNDKFNISKLEDEKNKLNRVNETQKELFETTNKFNSIIRECNLKQKEIENFNIKIGDTQFNIDANRYDIKSIQNEEFKEMICQECGKIANSKEKEFFEKHKEERIAKLKEKEVELEKQKKILIENQNDSIKYLSEVLEPKYDNLEKEVDNARKAYDESYNINVDLSEATKNIGKQINIEEINLDTLKKELEELKPELEAFNNIYTKINYINNNTIVHANKEKEKVISELDDLQLKLTLLNEMNIEYIKLVEQAISDTFGDIKFNMIKEGKTSGKEKMSCYAVQDDKPIYNYNTASEVALGCKIIQLIKNKLEVKGLPILFDIVDNIGEKSLNDIMQYCDSQLFCTKALFEENKELKLISDIKEIK